LPSVASSHPDKNIPNIGVFFGNKKPLLRKGGKPVFINFYPFLNI
jgi:hypothetical protein